MARDPAQGGGDNGPNTPKELPQHPLVDRLKPDPVQVARKVVTLVGLPGKSDRAGYQRLYLTPKLNYYAEFQISDMVHTETVPADQSPISGQEATKVTIERDATIHYIWVSTAQSIDEFDLDVRLGAQGAVPAVRAALPHTRDFTPCETCFESCGGSCVTCNTCGGNTCGGNTCANTCANTCNTCATQCNQQTCAFTCSTCFTQCNQDTCNTCATQCNQQTCNTCATQCHQQTCANTQCNQQTCQTCHTRCGTCGEATCNRTCQTCGHHGDTNCMC
jgi:hypothetical protein